MAAVKQRQMADKGLQESSWAQQQVWQQLHHMSFYAELSDILGNKTHASPSAAAASIATSDCPAASLSASDTEFHAWLHLWEWVVSYQHIS